MKKTSDTDNVYSSADLYYSAYLQVAGVPMVGTRKENNRVFFLFDMSLANLEELKNAWFSGTGKIPAQPYAHAIRSLKSLCHAQ